MFFQGLIDRRASRGARRLDEVESGWPWSIDPTKLKMWTLDQCVLGQLYGNYRLGLMKVDCDLDEDVSHGFAPTFWGSIFLLYALRLARAWKREIRSRLAAAIPAA